ncbi:hypothetical protein WDZ92_26270, partial [Nostoc sp. NIES-2111]
LHAPWFLLSIEVNDADCHGTSITRTICIAWEQDLADALGAIPEGRVTGIICMVPGWQTSTGQWASREIREVWVHRSARRQHAVLVDAAGERFDRGLVPAHVGVVERKLVYRVDRVPASSEVSDPSGSVGGAAKRRRA